MINHGFILSEIVENDHYMLGGYGSLGGTPLNPSRDWRNVVPSINEVQNLNGIEPQACTTFGTLNAVETLYKFIYGKEINYSDRWLAKKSGTIPTAGNNCHVVAETLRKKGDVIESEWPFDSTIKTPALFYAEPPTKLDIEALIFDEEFDFGHEWVPTTAKSLYDALQLSPLGFSVFAWVQDENGLYYKPQGQSDCHWVCLVYAEWEKYWLVLDSYMDNGELYKKVRWDALPQQAKRYTLSRQVVNETAWTKFLNLIKSILTSTYGKISDLALGWTK